MIIDTSHLNVASKEFPKEISEIKYLFAVVNDIYAHFNNIKNSIECENRNQIIFLIYSLKK